MKTVSPLSRLAVAVGAALSLGACSSSPLATSSTDDLRRSVIDSTRREIEDARTRPSDRSVQREPDRLDFSEQRIEELDDMGGPGSYREVETTLDADLLGYQTDTVAISLRDAITRAVRNNLDIQSARLSPAITEQQLLAAEAAFDWVLFASGSINTIDSPSRVPVINGVPVGSAINKSVATGFETGVRKQLTSGALLTVRTGLDIQNNMSPGVELFPDPGRIATLDLLLEQPLLRNFGADANLAEVRLARNLERDAIEQLRSQLIQLTADVEQAYWNLYFANIQLLVQERLLQRGIETRDVLEGRLEFDVRPAEYSDAVATVESRRGDVIRAENLVRQRSDALKLLINDSEITVGDELVLLPLDEPVDESVDFNLLDAITTALQLRPEIRRAVLNIDDAAIRQTLADNAALPLLDLTLRATYTGLDDSVGGAFDDVGDASFVDYLVALTFEQPIGNRAGEALSRQRRLERLQAVIGYRSQVQQVVLQVKTALRNLVTNYRLITQTRTSRLAAAENLRTLLVEEESTRALTPAFLDLKLRRQESLAVAELQEIQALIDYNVALANLYTAIGSSLDRNRIDFVVPDVGDFDSEPAWNPDRSGITINDAR